MISANAAMTGFYDYSEVARSVLIAIAASYAALDLTGRVTAARGRIRLAWLGGGATAMGIGIWAMHIKGMLAFHLPVPVEYHWPTFLASLLVAILASAVALYVASRQKMGRGEALTGSVIMASGIAGMHYIGMAAMRLPAIARFSLLLVTISVLFAFIFSLVALLMAFDLREETRWTVPRRLGSATVMGLAVSAMHYTGMAAASFIPASPPDLSHAVSISPFANNGIAIVTFIVLVAAFVTSSVDRRASVEVQRLNQELERRVAERTLELEAVNQTLRKEIAERERAEDELRKQKEVFQKIFEDIPVMIGFVGKDGRIELVNSEWQRTVVMQFEIHGAGFGFRSVA
jgi:two-component system, sensor histidine kinase and response regulator